MVVMREAAVQAQDSSSELVVTGMLFVRPSLPLTLNLPHDA